MLCRVPEGDEECPPDVLYGLLRIEGKLLTGEDGLRFFRKQRVDGRHKDIHDGPADENEDDEEYYGEHDLDGDHAGLYPAVHVLGVPLDDAVNPVPDADSGKKEGDDQDDVEDDGQDQVLAELVFPYQAERLGVGDEPACDLFLYSYHLPVFLKKIAPHGGAKNVPWGLNYTPRASMAAWYFLRRNLVLSSRRSWRLMYLSSRSTFRMALLALAATGFALRVSTKRTKSFSRAS